MTNILVAGSKDGGFWCKGITIDAIKIKPFEIKESARYN